MSLFIATLAFQGTPLLDQAKLGILAGSVVAGTVGAVITVRYRSGDSRQ
jgi:NhaA family Na+:H+ antiporter